MDERGKKVHVLVPLNLDGFILDGWESAKAKDVRARIAADFADWDKDDAKFHVTVKQLIRALQLDDAGREPAPEPKL